MTALPDIAELIPHTPPMVLIDRLTVLEPKHVAAETTLAPGSLDDTGEGVGSAWALEIVAQCCAALIGFHYRDRGYTQGRLIQSRRWSLPLNRLPTVEKLTVEATLNTASEMGVFLFSGKISAADTLLGEGELTILAQ